MNNNKVKKLEDKIKKQQEEIDLLIKKIKKHKLFILAEMFDK